MKKKPEEHENHERWLVSYADFITLLFAFFVVMYAVSSVNEGKYRTLSESLVSAFTNNKPVGFLSVIELPFEKRKAVVTKDPPQIKEPVPVYINIANVLSSFKTPVGVTVKSTDRGLNIRIQDDALFPSGRANMNPQIQEFLDLLAGLVKPLPNLISIEGHTDSLPIHSKNYPSNWELSVSRANLLVRYFTEHHQLDPTRFSTTGYAGYRPVASNDTPDGRALNRRVEIVILRHTHPPQPDRSPFLS